MRGIHTSIQHNQPSSDKLSQGVISYARTAAIYNMQPKGAARGMANPRQSDWDRLIRIGKFLKGKPRYVVVYKPQKDVYCINGLGDSVFAS